MTDIDFFKSVNDRYGHATGDQVIKTVADVLKNCSRDTDIVGRYGGEEFCVILPNLDLEKAAQVAERIRNAIEKISCSGVKITVSMGVSSLKQSTNKPDELINQADKALYAAKKSGRNRVVTWGKDFIAVATVDGGAEIQQPVSQYRKSTSETARPSFRKNWPDGPRISTSPGPLQVLARRKRSHCGAASSRSCTSPSQLRAARTWKIRC